jgi:hypothetical protein
LKLKAESFVELYQLCVIACRNYQCRHAAITGACNLPSWKDLMGTSTLQRWGKSGPSRVIEEESIPSEDDLNMANN